MKFLEKFGSYAKVSKCFKVFLCSFLLVFLFSFNLYASTITHTHTKNFSICEGVGGEGPIVKLFTGDTFAYSHEMPSDFEVPYDKVYAASLKITGYYIDSDDHVYIGDDYVGELNEGGSISYNWVWTGFLQGYLKEVKDPSVSNFDVSAVFNFWETGRSFDVSIKNEGRCNWFDAGFLIASSDFTLEYENAVAAHAPEPSTMILFGLGLLGFGVFAGKRFRKN